MGRGTVPYIVEVELTNLVLVREIEPQISSEIESNLVRQYAKKTYSYVIKDHVFLLLLL
jgi:hypothetical protein